MPWKTQEADNFEQEARRLVKEEASTTAGQGLGRLRRWTSKRELRDGDAVAIAMGKYVNTHQGQYPDMIRAFNNLLKTSTTNTEDLTRQMDGLLPILLRSNTLDLLNTTLDDYSPQAIKALLSDAIRTKDLHTVDQLLGFGVDPWFLKNTEIIELVELDPTMLERLQAKCPFNEHKLRGLCISAIESGKSAVLSILLRQAFDVNQSQWLRVSAADRDVLLIAAMRNGHHHMINDIAQYTADWPLVDALVLRTALETTEKDASFQRSVTEALLVNFQLPSIFRHQHDIEYIFLYCMRSHDRTAVYLLIHKGVQVPFAAIQFALENEDNDMFDLMLRANIEVPDYVWTYTASLSKHNAGTVREMIVENLLARSIEIPQKQQLLLQAIKAHQLQLVRCALSLGASVDDHGGQPLCSALLVSDAEIVHVLLGTKVNATTLECGLMASRFLPPANRGKLTTLLLSNGIHPRREIIELLLLQMLCDSSTEYDQPTADAFYEYLGQFSSRYASPDENPFNPKIVAACLNSKREIQTLLKTSPVPAGLEWENALPKTLSASFGAQEEAILYSEFVTASGDTLLSEILADFDLLPSKLLKKHLMECGHCIAGGKPWPMGIVSLLLGHPSVEAKKSTYLYDSLALSANYYQGAVFRKLLGWTEFSREGFRALPVDRITNDTTILQATLDRLEELHTNAEDYVEIVRPWFAQLCFDGQLLMATHISTKAPKRFSLSPVVHAIKTMINVENQTKNMVILLRTTIVSQRDLEVLWIEVFSKWSNSQQRKARLILRAGYTGRRVVETILHEASFGGDFNFLAALLEDWQTNKSLDLRPSFDYQKCQRIPPKIILPSDSDEAQYYPTLAAALSAAIQAQQADLCRLLFEKKAPLVWQDTSLIEDAVCFGKSTSLREDLILQMFLNAAMTMPEAQDVLDFTLLHAVKYDRKGLVLDLVQLGASPFAYDSQCWYLAADSDDDPLFQALLTSDTAQTRLSTSAWNFFSDLIDDVDKIDSKCKIMSRLHDFGLGNRDVPNWALVTLADSGMLTPHRVELLLKSGASVEHNRCRCLESPLDKGDLLIFEYLVNKIKDSEEVSRLFVRAYKKISSDGPGGLVASQSLSHTLDALKIILARQIPRTHLDQALNDIAVNAGTSRDLIPILSTLLCHGAHFEIELGGEALFRCCMFNDENLLALSLGSQPSETIQSAAFRSLVCKVIAEESTRADFNLPPLCLSLPQFHLKVPYSTMLEIIGIILFSKSAVRPDLISRISTWVELEQEPEKSVSDYATEFEALIMSAIGNVDEEPILHFTRSENISLILRTILQNEASFGHPELYQLSLIFKLEHESLNNLLLLALEKGEDKVAYDLLGMHDDPNVMGPTGESALYLAVKGRNSEIVTTLITMGAQPNDGSLHMAMCNQSHEMVEKLLETAHSPTFKSPIFGGKTALQAFVEYDHAEESCQDFAITLSQFLPWMYHAMGVDAVLTEITSALEATLTSPRASRLLDAMWTFFVLFEEGTTRLCDVEISMGDLRYSVLSFVKDWEGSVLSEGEKFVQIEKLEEFGVKPKLYAIEGDQPPNAINIPLGFMRAHAFKTKECAVCMDKAESEHQIYSGLEDACEEHHGWADEIICADCLREHLHTKMFPHEDENVKYRFPSSKVPCWAPNCQNATLTHGTLHELVDEALFETYDRSLCQMALNSENSLHKCATPGCAGAVFIEDDDQDEELKVFFCPICFDNTCIECNDLYEKHDNEPCPAGAEARKGERVKEEERLTELALLEEKRCPKCQLLYQKYYGCDHIVCGKNVYDGRVDKGCRHEFCNLCFGDWPDGHTAECIYEHGIN